MIQSVRDCIFVDILLNNAHRTGVVECMTVGEYMERKRVSGS